MTYEKMARPITDEIVDSANVEKTLAKYFGLSVTKDEVRYIKNALKKRNKVEMNQTIQVLFNKRWTTKTQ